MTVLTESLSMVRLRADRASKVFGDHSGIVAIDERQLKSLTKKRGGRRPDL
jgi:hypothetical protein